MHRPGWRADLASTLAFVRATPQAWLLGSIGMSLRGGIALLTLPIMILPTQVEARLLLGDNLGTTGLSPGFWWLVGAATLLTLVVLLGVFYVLARVELGGFARLVHDPASAEQREWREPQPLSGRARRMLLARLFTVQALGALALLVSAVPLAVAIRDASLAEILFPSSTVSLYARITARVVAPALVLAAALPVVELLTAHASRALLAHGYGLDPLMARPSRSSAGLVLRGVTRALLNHPARTLANAALGWALFAASFLGASALIGVSWQAVRSVFLTSAWSEPLQQAVGLFAVATLLAAAFAMALLLLGIVSAVRASLASLASLR